MSKQDSQLERLCGPWGEILTLWSLGNQGINWLLEGNKAWLVTGAQAVSLSLGACLSQGWRAEPAWGKQWLPQKDAQTAYTSTSENKDPSS